ncbi:unnamed protein product, partial [Prorocentrum cordatum]
MRSSRAPKAFGVRGLGRRSGLWPPRAGPKPRALASPSLVGGGGGTGRSIAYNAIMSACEKGLHWAGCLELLREARVRGLRPDATSYNTAMQACHGLGVLDALFDEMAGEGVRADLQTCRLLAAACERGPALASELRLLGAFGGPLRAEPGDAKGHRGPCGAREPALAAAAGASGAGRLLAAGLGAEALELLRAAAAGPPPRAEAAR